jgi:hypothetical protein
MTIEAISSQIVGCGTLYLYLLHTMRRPFISLASRLAHFIAKSPYLRAISIFMTGCVRMAAASTFPQPTKSSSCLRLASYHQIAKLLSGLSRTSNRIAGSFRGIFSAAAYLSCPSSCSHGDHSPVGATCAPMGLYSANIKHCRNKQMVPPNNGP